MPLYDFRCPSCGRTYEVLRPVGRLDDPLLCMDDRTPCERALTTANFVTRSSGAPEPSTEPEAAPPPASGTWSHFGHSHSTGSRTHAHEAEQATPES